MIVTKKHSESLEHPVMMGDVSWIVKELIGIRSLEQRLSKQLDAKTPGTNHESLLTHIRALNTRVDLLDLALEDYSAPDITRN